MWHAQERPERVDVGGRRVGVEGALVLCAWLTGHLRDTTAQRLTSLHLDRCRLAGRDCFAQPECVQALECLCAALPTCRALHVCDPVVEPHPTNWRVDDRR